MKNITLYHGTDVLFDEFDNKFISGKCSIDQYGSGFYFFDNPAKTVRYGNIIVECNVSLMKVLDFHKQPRKGITRMDVERMILAAPDLEEKLNNVNDVEYYGFDKVLREAIGLYSTGDVVHTLNCIGTDFFAPEETHILLDKFTELTGYNCVCDKELGIYNVFTKRHIRVIRHASLDDYE